MLPSLIVFFLLLCCFIVATTYLLLLIKETRGEHDILHGALVAESEVMHYIESVKLRTYIATRPHSH